VKRERTLKEKEGHESIDAQERFDMAWWKKTDERERKKATRPSEHPERTDRV